MQLLRELYAKPVVEQLPEWRRWAASPNLELKCEALAALAWMRDPEGVRLATVALGDPSAVVQGQAATALATYGSPMADGSRPQLLASFASAGLASKPQIAWALVELGDDTLLDQILALYRTGQLSKVQRLDGGSAFDANQLAAFVGPDRLAAMASDPSPAIRSLSAIGLSRAADSRAAALLIGLLSDSDPEVARWAAPGLVRLGSKPARQALVDTLRGADQATRTKLLETLRDEVGGEGLILALDSVVANDGRLTVDQTAQIFEMLDRLNDPRVPEGLLAYVSRKPHIHWVRRAATAMGRVGDERAVPILANQLRLDPLKIYSDTEDWEMWLKRDDNERVVAARLIADVAALHPERLGSMRRQAEDGLVFWLHAQPSPHANGMRALATLRSQKDIRALRAWSNPQVKLPVKGQQPPMPEEWVVAQSALRYLGRLKDGPSWRVCEQMLKKRPLDLDVTMNSLMEGGTAILAMSLRAIGGGASQCFAEWGDPRAVGPLLQYVEDPKNNELSRMDACAALAWVSTEQQRLTLARKAVDYRNPDDADRFRRSCLLQTIVTRATPSAGNALLPLLSAETPIEVRHQVARAIGRATITREVAAKLFELLDDDALVSDAALALILGGTPELAARAVAKIANRYRGEKYRLWLDDLGELYYRSLGYWSTEDLEKGRIFAVIDNAITISRTQIDHKPQVWAATHLQRRFDDLEFDNGPHSLTRTVLRYRLWRMARSDQAGQHAAITALLFLKEQGVLLALRDQKGETGKLARRAYHVLMNPQPVVGVPEIEATR